MRLDTGALTSTCRYGRTRPSIRAPAVPEIAPKTRVEERRKDRKDMGRSREPLHPVISGPSLDLERELPLMAFQAFHHRWLVLAVAVRARVGFVGRGLGRGMRVGLGLF